jgi:hypothetical protein
MPGGAQSIHSLKKPSVQSSIASKSRQGANLSLNSSSIVKINSRCPSATISTTLQHHRTFSPQTLPIGVKKSLKVTPKNTVTKCTVKRPSSKAASGEQQSKTRSLSKQSKKSSKSHILAALKSPNCYYTATTAYTAGTTNTLRNQASRSTLVSFCQKNTFQQ